MSAIRGHLCVAATVVALAALSIGTIPAARASAPTPAGTAPVLVILDASGSMTTADAPGPRIDAAKHAVDALVGALAPSAQIGLEVYGTSTDSSAAAKPAGCKDIKLVIPVSPIRRGSFLHTVSRIRASGYTPIGLALRRAAAALPQEGPRSIVLVSDGEDTCAPPDPCLVAKQLKQQGTDLVVHTVGFKVDDAARRQLQCIAAATGGTYRDAGDGSSLARGLQDGVQRGLQPYAAVGTPVAGADSAVGAPRLEPGQYLDSFARGGSGGVGSLGTEKYYTIELHRGQAPYVSATVIPAAVRTSGTALAVDIELTDVQQSGCQLYGSGYDMGFGQKVSATTAVLSPGPVGGSQWPSECPTDGLFAVKIARRSDAFAGQPLQMEIGYRLEQAADDSGLPLAAQPQPLTRATPSDAPRSLAAGSSFNDAPLVGPGVYRDSFVSGETRFYKVHLDWGQRLSYVITPAKLAGLSITGGVTGYSRLASPVRAQLTQPDDSHTAATFLGSEDGALYGSGLVPARYTNRDSTDDAVRGYALAGDYYLILSTGFTEHGVAPLQVPYTLGISVTGAIEPGPRYAPAPPVAPPTPRPTPTPVPASPVAAAHSATDSSVPAPAVVVGGLVVALIAAVGVLLVRRRRRDAAS